jgi:hypothetical protein
LNSLLALLMERCEWFTVHFGNPVKGGLVPEKVPAGRAQEKAVR